MDHDSFWFNSLPNKEYLLISRCTRLVSNEDKYSIWPDDDEELNGTYICIWLWKCRKQIQVIQNVADLRSGEGGGIFSALNYNQIVHTKQVFCN